MRKLIVVAAGVLALGLAGSAEANVIYAFDAITSNDPADVAAGEAQIQVGVDSGGPGVPGTAEFVFTAHNVDSPEALSITEITFDDGIQVLDFPAFSLISLDLQPQYALSYHSEGPGVHVLEADGPDRIENGIGHDEGGVAVLVDMFDLNLGGVTGMDVLYAALDQDPRIGDVRITLTVEGFADGGLERFQLAPRAVPEPGAGLLLASSALAALALRRCGRAGKR